MLDSLREEVTKTLANIRPMTEEEQQQLALEMAEQRAEMEKAANPAPQQGDGVANEGFDETDPSTWGNPGRNELCPCGSGKKFKHCHGRLV